MRRILSVLMENEPGALSRVVGLFSQRGYNIESLNVAPTTDHTLSRLTLTTTGDDLKIEQITKHLNKIVTLVNNSNVDLIIYAPFEPIKNIDWLSQKTKIKAIELPFSIDKSHNVEDLFELFNQILNKLEQNT